MTQCKTAPYIENKLIPFPGFLSPDIHPDCLASRDVHSDQSLSEHSDKHVNMNKSHGTGSKISLSNNFASIRLFAPNQKHYSLHGAFKIQSQKFFRLKSGSIKAQTSAFILPKVVSVLCSKP